MVDHDEFLDMLSRAEALRCARVPPVDSEDEPKQAMTRGASSP